jgi:hypothetical protein
MEKNSSHCATAEAIREQCPKRASSVLICKRSDGPIQARD